MQESMFPEQEAPMLKCSRCKKFLPATREYFYVYNGNRTGFRSRCKDCIRLIKEKRCRHCKKTLPAQDFYSVTSTSDGLTPWCRSCMKKSAQNRPNLKENGRRTNLKRYGISIEAYDELMQKQNGVCASCGGSEVLSKYNKIAPLSVDHCHVTGKVRGLLCNSCNVALGHLKDDPERIKALLKYLESHNNSH